MSLKPDPSLAPLLIGICLALSSEELLAGPIQQQLPPKLCKTLERLEVKQSQTIIIVNVKNQTLTLFEKGTPLLAYPISTAKNGTGCLEGSFKTPLGLHRIKKKIGSGTPLYGRFISRSYTGDVYLPNSKKREVQNTDGEEDMVLSRILWLEGLEKGINQGKDSQGRLVDSFERYIYLHGTNHEDRIGSPASQGCVRMLTADIISLYDRVNEDTLVWITE
jgi:lipoprotein-anchoring transpeptidase ErfK/SrfK